MGARATVERRDADTSEGGSKAWLAAAGLYLYFIGVSLIQQPGATTYDTRAELTQRPLSFLRDSFTLWHPDSNFGEFQNQGYGYLFPQGTWFVLGHLAHMPAWVSQRLWSALVLIIAIEGARRVAGAVGMSPPVALLSGLVFGFSPRLLGSVAVITGEALPGAVMPWVVLPVLLAFSGRLAPRRAALLSGAAVVCMGGVNAVENIGSLVLVVIVVWWGVRRGLVPRRFAAWWAGAVFLASIWWVLPLLVLAKYAPPFYEYVESASDTTAIIGWAQATRGDSTWVDYLITGDQAWWPAAHDLVSVPWLVALSAVIAAFGLWGLARWDHALRRPMMVTAVIGLAALTVAHGGWEGSPVGGPVRTLLDGSLQIFRNVHKIDPIVRLPIALGVGNAVAIITRAMLARRPRWESGTTLVVLIPALLVLALGQPYLVNHARTPGWDEISAPWVQARDYLAEHQDGRSTLVLPGTGFAQETWGWTLDEPLLILGGVDFVSRSQVPIIPGQSIRYLAALDQLATTGRASPDFAEQLARAGIGHVVIRRDLQRDLTGSPYPGGSAVSAANGGLTSVASFGDIREGGAEVEVLDVPDSLPTVRSTPVADVVTVRGAPESILSLQDAGLVAPGQATVLEGEPGWSGAAQVVTDSDQRRERAFGSSDNATSAVMGPQDPWRTSRAVHDYPSVPGEAPVVAHYDGLSSLLASSSQGYADNFGPVVPQAGPYAAVDGDPSTRWITSAATDPRTQWLRMVFDAPRPVHEVTILPVVDDSQVAPIHAFAVHAGDQVRTVAASPSGAPSVVHFDGRPVTSVEIQITAAGTTASHARVGLREVSVDGLTPTRSLVVPGTVADGASWLFDTAPEQRACVATIGLPDCDVARIRGPEEAQGMDRTFTTSDPSQVRIHGEVVARSTREAALLLEPVLRREVGATSIYGSDPKVSSRFAYDGQDTTAWVSDDDDPDPTLLFHFARTHSIKGLTVHAPVGVAPPTAVIVRAGGEAKRYRLSASGTARFGPVTGRNLEVEFVKAPGEPHVTIAEIHLDGAKLTRPLYADAPTGAVCGLGPNIDIDGVHVSTKVTGNLADIINGTPLSFESCRKRGGTQPGEIDLPEGSHRLTAPSTSQFQVTQVVGVPKAATSTETASPAGQRSVQVASWGTSRRVVDVAGGDASVLWLPENFNPGWVAEADGHQLAALHVDGWSQGWILPAGAATQVVLTYRPQALYRVLLPLGLGLSGAILLGGLGLLLWGARPRRRVVRSSPDQADDRVDQDVDAQVDERWPPAPPGPGLVTVLALGVVAIVLLGPVAAAGLVVGALAGIGHRRTAWWTTGRCAAYGALLIVASALLDLPAGPGWFLSAADALAALGVGLLAGLALAPLGRRRGGARRAEGAAAFRASRARGAR